MNLYPFSTPSTTPVVGYALPAQQQTIPQAMSIAPQPQQPMRTEIPRAANEDSIRAVQMAPDSSVFFFSSDKDSDIAWIVVTDSTGYKTITKCHVIPFVEEPPVTLSDLKTKFDEFDERIRKVEERMNANGQSSSKSSWQGSKPTASNGTGARNDQSRE